MALKDKTNGELFKLYDSDLTLRLQNAKNLSDTRTMLLHFREYLGEYPPSPELAKGFLAQYSDRKPRTLYRYAQMIKAFMKWYGEPLDDVKVRLPKSLPAYTESSDIEKLLAVIPNKRSHKGCIERDRLMVEVAWRTGLRRAELAYLRVKDVHVDSLMVRGGKGKKDRLVPLPQSVSGKLQEHIKDKGPDEKVFGLGAPAIGMKIKQFAMKAGLTDFHTHTLRHKYATDLLESGANIKVVQALLGHENLNTTEVYLSITNKDLYEAVKKLDEHQETAIQDRGRDATRVFESSAELTLRPTPCDPMSSFKAPGACAVFVLNLQANSVLIENIQVRSSDAEIQYRLLLFEAKPPEDPTLWENEDMIRMDDVRQRVFTYSPNAPLPYTDQDKLKQLHCALGIGQRPIRFDVSYDRKEAVVAFQAPVRFIVTLRYKLLLHRQAKSD